VAHIGARPAHARSRETRHHITLQQAQIIESPYTVSVYPIEQEPGVWFAAYLIREYKDGMERVVANVAMRHDTHRTAARAKHAARCAGEGAITRLAARHHQPGASAHANQGARHG